MSEKKVVSAVEFKEGTTVDILTGTNKGRVAIYKATNWKFEVSKNCDIHYVSKILSKNRYNGLNYAYITLGTMETRIILRIESVTCMLQFLKLMPTMKSISKVSRLL